MTAAWCENVARCSALPLHALLLSSNHFSMHKPVARVFGHFNLVQNVVRQLAHVVRVVAEAIVDEVANSGIVAESLFWSITENVAGCDQV